MRYSNKKNGAVEMSLNLIILLVIGLTVMGLVIGFVTKLIGGATNQFDSKLKESESIEKQKVLDAPGFFAVGPEILKIKAGQNSKLFIKINNLGNSPLDINSFDGSNLDGSGDVSTGKLSFENTPITGNCDVQIISGPLTIKSKDTQVLTLIVKAPKDSCSIGNELFLNSIFEFGDDIRETRSISVEIVS